MNSRWVKSESVLDKNNNNNCDGQHASLPKPGGPLKPRIDAVQKKIRVQIRRLEELYNILKLRDNEIFHKLMASIKENNVQHSTALSSELARARQLSRLVLFSCSALDKLIANLSSALNFGDLVIVLSPTLPVVKNVRSSLTPYVPELEEELGTVSELLSGILVDAGQVGGYTINFKASNEEAVRLIGEVSLAVDQKMKEEFPTIPELPVIYLKFA
jgi:division protein CdvB (Snf7/Vps24/ESCRT-III family)